MDSIALLDGTIVDGTSGPAYRGDLLLREGRIEAITRGSKSCRTLGFTIAAA